jgi:hypothetical protein
MHQDYDVIFRTYNECHIIVTFEAPESNGSKAHGIPQEDDQAADSVPCLQRKESNEQAV